MLNSELVVWVQLLKRVDSKHLLKTWITWSQTKSIACIFTFNHLADAFIQSDVQMRRTIKAIRPSREQQYTSAMTSLSYAKFTLHDFSPIFHSPTGFDESPTNARDRKQLGARSREWQSRSVNYQRHDLRESPTRRRRPWNIWHAKYLELSAILNPAVWMSSDLFWLKNTSAMTYSHWESKIQGSWKFEEGIVFLFVFFFNKASIRIYRTGRLHEDEEGARVFPVNNILL